MRTRIGAAMLIVAAAFLMGGSAGGLFRPAPVAVGHPVVATNGVHAAED